MTAVQVCPAVGIADHRTESPAAAWTGGGAAARVPVDRGELAATLAALARKHQVPGAQLAVHGGGMTVTVEVGELEHGAGAPVTRDTAFPIGSISKSFTATVAMVLVADGDLELDEPLRGYLPELDEPTGRLTLRQVLSHTSGLASGPGSAELADVSLRRYMSAYCRGGSLLLAPGSGFSYSNMGYLLVGRLIEEITGMSWREAVESVLLHPLHIEAAFIGASARRPTGSLVATGHSVNTAVGRTRPVRQSQAPVEAPAGALAVSAADLVRFAQLHVGSGRPEVLSMTDAAQMRQAVPAADPFGLADGWGLGLAVFRAGATDWVGHDGNADGTSCYFRVDPATGWIVAFTSNANTGLNLWEDLLPELRRAGVPIGLGSSGASHGPPVAPRQGCAGTYSNGYSDYVFATDGDGRFCLFADGELSARLSFYDDTHFTLRDPSTDQGTQLGRVLLNPVTGEPQHIQIGGRVSHRRPLDTDRLAS